MKKKLMRSVMLLLALTWIIPKANAQYTFELAKSPTWTAITASSSSADATVSGYQPSVSSEGIVFLMTTDNKSGVLDQYYTFNSSGATLTSSGSYVGTAGTFDDKGNYVYHGNWIAEQSYTSTPTRYVVKPVSGISFTNYSYVDAYDVNAGDAAYFVEATGDFTRYGTSEAYLWYATSANGTITALNCTGTSTSNRDRTASSKLTFTTGIIDSDQRENYVQFYDTSDKTAYKCLMQLRGTGIYDVTLNLNTQKVVSCVKIPDANSNCSSLGAHIFTLAGSKFLVRTNPYSSSGTSSTRFQVMNIDDPANPIQVGDNLDPFPQASTISIIGAFTVSRKVSDTEVELYVYAPGNGVAAYKFTATPRATPASNVVAAIEQTEPVAYPGRQDAVITWNAPATTSLTVKGYNIYCYQKYTDYSGQEETYGWYQLNSDLITTTSYTHKDVKWVTVSSGVSIKTHERSYTYRVEPVYTDGQLGGYATSNVVTPDMIPITPVWLYDGNITNYDGYCKTQMFWNYPDYGVKPNWYNVWRINQLTGEEEQINFDAHGTVDRVIAFLYIDATVIPGQTYTYKIQSCYDTDDYQIASQYEDMAFSRESKQVEIGIRDYAKPSYTIEKVYEYAIGQTNADEVYDNEDGIVKPGENGLPANFANGMCYKQGVWYKGYWYIAQMTDDHAKAYNPGVGGIIKVNADDPRVGNDNKEARIYTGTKVDVYCDAAGNPVSTARNVGTRENTGIAVDESGTFFTRRYQKEGEYAYNDTWNFTCPVRYARLINFEKNFQVDVSFADFDWCMGDYDTYKAEAVAAGNTTVPGRSDYYALKGDLYNDGFCYLYVAPSVTKCVYVFKLTSTQGAGKVPTEVTQSLVASYKEDGSNLLTGQAYSWNNESYAFPINCVGREDDNEFVHQIRSTMYSARSATNANLYSSAADRVIYDTYSRVNSAGGFTFEFNGELFIITPQGQNSVNTGNFYVGMARRFETAEDGTTSNLTAAKADITDIIPAAQWFSGHPTGTYSDHNGFWIYAEEAKNADGTVVDENKDGQADYAYIWTYRQGYYFGKYILKPSSLFPPTQIYLSIDAQYGTLPGTTTENTDLVQYDANVSWSDVPGYGVTEGGNILYHIQGYTVVLRNEAGEDVGKIDVLVTFSDKEGEEGKAIAVTDLDGNPIDVKITSSTTTVGGDTFYVNTYEYTFPDVDAIDDEGNKQEFIAEIIVNYIGNDDEQTKGLKFNSEPTEYEDLNGYVPVAPGGKVTVNVNSSQTEGNPTGEGYSQWADWNANGVKDADDGYFRDYEVLINIDEPETTEPVSYYEVAIDKDGDNIPDEIVKVTPDGEYNLLNDTPFDGYEDGTGEGMVPGTYDFDDNGDDPDVISFNVRDYVGSTDGNYPGDGVNDPTEWTYIITAVYAGGNEQITQNASAENVTAISVPTSVEEIEVTDNYLRVFPVPATTTVTVLSSEAVDQVTIFTVAGVAVKSVDGNSEHQLEVSVEDLADGYYFLKVNDKRPVKILVK